VEPYCSHLSPRSGPHCSSSAGNSWVPAPRA
jgi:hypothetical protein